MPNFRFRTHRLSPSWEAPNGLVYIYWDDHFPEPPWENGLEIITGLSEGSLTSLHGGSINRHFGEEIQASGDFNGDGGADLFIGELTAEGKNGFFSGVGYVFFDAENTLRGQTIDLDDLPAELPLTIIHGPSRGALAGDAAIVGDLNGDGIADLAMGSPHDSPAGRLHAGSGHVLFGRRGGWHSEIDLAPGKLPLSSEVEIALMEGARGAEDDDMGDTLFYSGASGDLNGDGITDLIINEMVGNGTEPDRVDTGNLLVISGSALSPVRSRPLVQIIAIERMPPNGWRLSYEGSEVRPLVLEISQNLLHWETLKTDFMGPGAVEKGLTVDAMGVESQSSQFYRIRFQ